jgi:putative hydrolase of the HAD superfamily
MRQRHALLVDLDDTLLDGATLPESVAKTCQLIADRAHCLDAAQLYEANAQAWQVYWPEVEGPWTLGELDSVTLETEVWRRTLSTFDVDDAELTAMAVHAFARARRDSYRLFEDATFALTQRGGAVRLGLVTNGESETQREKLDVLEIADLFDVVVVSGEVGVAKPSAEIFAVALDALSVPPARAWHVGDNLSTDVAGARAAGLTAVWLNRSGNPRSVQGCEPHLEIRDLRALEGILSEVA